MSQKTAWNCVVNTGMSLCMPPNCGARRGGKADEDAPMVWTEIGAKRRTGAGREPSLARSRRYASLPGRAWPYPSAPRLLGGGVFAGRSRWGAFALPAPVLAARPNLSLIRLVGSARDLQTRPPRQDSSRKHAWLSRSKP